LYNKNVDIKFSANDAFLEYQSTAMLKAKIFEIQDSLWEQEYKRTYTGWPKSAKVTYEM